MNINQEGQKIRRLTLPIALFAAGIVLAYVFFAYPFYMWMKLQIMKDAYQMIVQMDLSAMDEEDEEILQGYLDERMEIIITDEDFQPVYLSRRRDNEENIEKYIEASIDFYQTEPTVHIRRNSGLGIIRLRGLVEQEEKYYVCIRKELRGVGEAIQYSAWYYALVLAAGLAGWYALLWRRLKKAKAKGAAESLELQRKQASGGDAAEHTDGTPEQLYQAQKEFVANISHELKTPLAVISGQVEMLQSMGDGIDRAYYFESIREEIKKMSDMVGDLLDITIIDHNMEHMEMSEVDFSDLMEYMILKYDALFQKNKIKLGAEIARNCKVRANRMYLEQVVNNYMMNAFQHTAQGNKIQIRLEKEDGSVRLGVYNEGSAIEDGDEELIWESFYISDTQERQQQKIKNAGLGLYMVKKIVELHQGMCGAENREGGVEFWMRLPLKKDA